jgi:hypothetical protein
MRRPRNWLRVEPGTRILTFSRITSFGRSFYYSVLASFLLRRGRALFNAYMWRSNALRLGNCSSAKYLRHGVTVRWQSSERSLPVTEREFRHALKKVFKWESGTVNQVPLGMWNCIVVQSLN